ncbi:MAG TPA: ferritin [Caldithrix abyssi]|uniref:Ferritin n=1 Tax=Caldithrix abyssi TaxID=187145 RepID=A0A7V5LJK2_CALAY|nr:ferritin [Caldithrix abyssi]
MISKTLEKALNDQITHEFYSEYLYLAMASYCDSIDLGGFANWFISQAEEEHQHAMKLFKYVQDREGHVELGAIEKPEHNYNDVTDLFEKVLQHEQKVTQSINNIYEMAVKEKDYPTQVELEWFIKEQVEEEKQVSDILKQLKWVKDNPALLFMLDQKLGERTPGSLPAAE